ncbi:choline dehydrogenase-like protein [Tricladium varicosporioides]|nr:choline dehydrogenase-like protein [Hymenoscyphus varicosporioides]
MLPSFSLIPALRLLSFVSSVLTAPNSSQERGASFSAAKEQSYDYIIIGGGLSGLVVANRLSEDPKKSILVIESGYLDDSPAVTIPYMANILNTAAMWPVTSAPEPFLNNRTYGVRVGNIVGGGSMVNGMFFDRGSDGDYDAWEQLGNEGWGWNGMRKYFKKSTKFTPVSESTRKEYDITYDVSAYGDGPVQVSIPSFQWPDIKKIFNAWRAENIPMPIEGFTNAIGAYWCPADIDNVTATRSSAKVTYYDPVQTRSNLKLLTGTRVNQILFDGNDGALVAKGVRMISRADGSIAKVYANKEVILAAGGVFTPHLLMLSGIGPRDVLAAANITIKNEAPAVGSNFQDHVPLFMGFSLSNQTFPSPDLYTNNATFLAESEAQYALDRSGPWSTARANAAAFLTFKMISPRYESITAKIKQQNPTQYLPERYNKNKELLAGFKKQREILIRQYLGDDSAVAEFPIAGGGGAGVHQKPLSRGTVTLNSTNPEAVPIVQWNALQNPIDKEVLCEMVRFTRAHWARKELAGYAPVEVSPGAQYQTNEEIINRAIVSGGVVPTFAHVSGGCPMMPENLGGCVNNKLMVYGVEKLSIVDASIIPMIPATHLQATIYAIAEKAADIIKARG